MATEGLLAGDLEGRMWGWGEITLAAGEGWSSGGLARKCLILLGLWRFCGACGGIIGTF